MIPITAKGIRGGLYCYGPDAFMKICDLLLYFGYLSEGSLPKDFSVCFSTNFGEGGTQGLACAMQELYCCTRLENLIILIQGLANFPRLALNL